MKHLLVVPSLLAGLALTSCSTTAATVGAVEAPKAAAKSDAKPDEAAQRKKARDVEYAKLALESARMDAENDARNNRNAVEAAERELRTARAEQEHFEKTVVPLELDERALSVDGARQNVVEAKEELVELEAMYAQEDFAKTTKELVLMRGRKRLEMSERSLALAERRAVIAREFDHKKRAKEHAERVIKAESGLEDARARAKKSAFDRQTALLKAEHALEDAQRALDAAPNGA